LCPFQMSHTTNKPKNKSQKKICSYMPSSSLSHLPLSLFVSESFQLQDLLHIFDDAGNPSPSNKFIFNGDFVDRGPCSVEIIMILFSAFLAYPDAVFLNRGNHEVLFTLFHTDKRHEYRYDLLKSELIIIIYVFVSLSLSFVV
jgi:hypothetical protein